MNIGGVAVKLWGRRAGGEGEGAGDEGRGRDSALLSVIQYCLLSHPLLDGK